jgi:serine/threonine-protein kinase
MESLRVENPELANQLQGLLHEHESAQKEGFLEAGPALPRANPGLTGEMVGAYRLISPIGHGGMGSVWLAERSDGRFERKAAVKFLSIAVVGRGGEERFKREGLIVGRLSHPNIAELLDAGVSHTGQPYLVLEHVEGKPIDEYCDSRKLDVRSRVRLFVHVLGALAHAHANLIVHRDIKPSNVLVRHDGQVKLLDFGIATLLDEGADFAATTLITQQAGTALTPAYAAPEQINGTPITVSTDVYASGVLLYVLLSGRHPAGEGVNSPAELVRAILEKEPERASSVVAAAPATLAERRATAPDKLRRQLSGDLDAILLKALHKNPRSRYLTADAFAEDLRRYLTGDPVIAQPESTWYRTRKFLSRRRWAVASVTAIVLALALGLAASLWQAHIAKNETRSANAMEKFLEDIFRANSAFQDDPVKARQTTARELLDIGARKIDDELTGVPEVKIRMLHTLGTLYFDLGLSDQAVSMGQKRVGLVRNRYGKDSMELVQALTELGSALHASSSVGEREAVLLEAKGIMDRRHDSSSSQRGNLLIMLAEHYESSDMQQALDYSRQAVEVYRKYPGDSMLAESLYEQAIMLSIVGRSREAEPLLTEAIQVSARLEGDPNTNLARYYAYLGETQQNLTEFPGAEQSLRNALRAARKVNGEDHIDTLETEMRLGIFLDATSRTAEGLEHIQRANQILLRTRGADDPFFAPQVYLEYGRALANAGRWEEGLTYVSKAVENRRKNRPGTRYLAQMLFLQASVLIDLGRYAEAQRLLDEADLIAKKVNYPTAYMAADERARLLVATGRPGEADSALDAFHPATPVAGALELDSLRVQVSRAENALARGDSQIAAPLAAKVLQQVSVNAARDYLKRLEARAALVEGEADLRLGHPSDARPLLQRAVELRQSTVDPLSPTLALAQIELAECYLDLGDSDGAKAVAASAKRALASHHEVGSQYLRPLQHLEQRLHLSARGHA